MTTTHIEAESPTVCVRHPGRETAIRCQRCSDLICPECMVPAPVGFQCPSCVSSAAKQGRQIAALGATTPYLTYGLIAVNALVAFASVVSTPEWTEGAGGTVAARGGLIGGGFSFDGGRPHLIGVSQGEWYRIFTGAFIHGGPIHLLFNMLILWQAGAVLETVLGRARFAALYTAAVLGGSFGALLLSPDALTVGASGGVFGMMGALFIAQQKGLVSRQGSGVGFLIVINLALTFVVPGISIGGHLGGLAGGAVVGWTMIEFQRRQLSSVAPLAMAAGLSLMLFLGCLWVASFWMDPLFGPSR